MSRNARHPGRLRVPARDVREHKRQRRPVYSTARVYVRDEVLGRSTRGPRRGADYGYAVEPDLGAGVERERMLAVTRSLRRRQSIVPGGKPGQRRPALYLTVGNATDAAVAAAIADRMLA